MKKIIMPVVAVMLCMTGCKKEQEGGQPFVGEVSLRLETEDFNIGADIDVEDAAAYSVWDNEDLVKVNGQDYRVTVGDNGAEIRGFAASEGEAYSAVYPAAIVTAMSGNGATVKLPAVQQYRENAAGQQVVGAPMTAYCGSDENTLKFHNLGSLLAVKVENTTDGAMKVWRIRVEADRALSGTYTIADLNTPTLSNATEDAGNMVYLDFDKGVSIAAGGSKVFYMALPPVADASFAIEVYSSNTMYRRSPSTSATFERSTVHGLPFSTSGATTEYIMLYESSDAISCNMIFKSNTYDSGNKMGYITFASPITDITQQAFIGSGLTSIVIPEGVTSIERCAFYYCGILSSIDIPEGVTEIGEKSFTFCQNLTRIVIPEGVTEIGKETFKHCISLVSVDLPSSVEIIGQYAFSLCKVLNKIDIPSNVKQIEQNAFENCVKLSCINCWPKDPPVLGSNAFLGTQPRVVIHVRKSSLNSYIKNWEKSLKYLLTGNRLTGNRQLSDVLLGDLQ